MNASRHLILIGAGFAGLSFVRRLGHARPSGYALTVLSEESYTTFNPLLPEAVGASIFPDHVVAPVRELLKPAQDRRFIMGRVNAIDPHAQRVHCETLDGEKELAYDALVLAFGNRSRLDFIPGMQEHALPLKTVGDAMEIRNTILRRLAQMELAQTPEARKLLGSFIVIGGGFSGVEVAGEMIDCIQSMLRYYPRASRQDIRVTVVQDQPRLLLELPEALASTAQRSLEDRGVHVLLNARVQHIHADSVALTGAGAVGGATIICTIGSQPNPLAQQLADDLGLTLDRGRIPTQGDMRIGSALDRSDGGIWTMGDCAHVANARDGAICPPTAQFAVRQGRQLADNLLAHLGKRPTRPFRYRARGMLASIGHRKGVAQVFGLRVAGLPAWLL